MNPRSSSIVIGVGSSHGDDQFGWAVVDDLQSRDIANVALCKCNHPIDVIERLQTYERVFLVDACTGMPPGQKLRRLSYSDARDRTLLHELPGRSSHEIGLFVTLRLADSLGKPTDRVVLWIGKGRDFQRMSDMSREMAVTTAECADAIDRELCDARNVAC